MSVYNLPTGIMSSNKQTYISMTPSDDDDDDMFHVTKRPKRQCCCCIFYVTVVIVALLVIIGLAVGLGITVQKLNSSDSEAEGMLHVEYRQYLRTKKSVFESSANCRKCKRRQ